MPRVAVESGGTIAGTGAFCAQRYALTLLRVTGCTIRAATIIVTYLVHHTTGEEDRQQTDQEQTEYREQ